MARYTLRNDDTIDSGGNPVETSPGYPEPGQQQPEQSQAPAAQQPSYIWGNYGNLNDFISGEWGKGYTSPVDQNYWQGVINKNHPGGNIDYDYWSKRLRGFGAGGSDVAQIGEYAGQNFGSLQQQHGGMTPGGAGIFNTPALQNWENALNAAVGHLQTPQQNPAMPALTNYLNQYFQQLQGPAYTPAQMELQQTQSLEPLELQRAAMKQQATERLAAKGVQGGIVEKTMQDIDRQFNQLRTRTQADFATQGINAEKQQHAQAAQVGASLAGLHNQQFGSDEARMLQALGLLQQVPQQANQNIALANGVLQQTNPVALMQQYMNQSNQNQAYDQNFWSNIGQILAGLF